MAGNVGNLRPFKKGQSGNPCGRPRTFRNLRALLIRQYGQDARVLVDRLEELSRLTGARHGRLALSATELLLAYHSGRPQQALDFNTTPQVPIFSIRAEEIPAVTVPGVPGLSGAGNLTQQEEESSRG